MLTSSPLKSSDFRSLYPAIVLIRQSAKSISQKISHKDPLNHVDSTKKAIIMISKDTIQITA